MSSLSLQTGFEYKKQRAIPIATGVVVAEENRDFLMDVSLPPLLSFVLEIDATS